MEINLVKSKPGGTMVANIRGELPDVSDIIKYYSTGKRLFMIQKNAWGHKVIEYNIEDGTWNINTIRNSNIIFGSLNPDNIISKEDILKEIEKMRMLAELKK